MRSLWYVFLVFLAAGQGVEAKVKDPNNLDKQLLAKWDAVIKDPNDPGELLQAKWDAIVNVLQAKDLESSGT